MSEQQYDGFQGQGKTNSLSSQARKVYEELLARVPENKVEARLEPMIMTMDLLGNPQHSCPIIHVTGTNGKTSTARMIEAGLRACGLRTGLFTSPHLNEVTERIGIDGAPLTDAVFVRAWQEVKPYIEITDARLEEKGESKLTFFEALTVVAFAVFADVPVDVLVLEVGLGGITDATNVADAAVAVMAPISLDHTDLLGDTTTDIAVEKVGVIKPGSYVISARQDDEATAVIVSQTHRLGNPSAWEGHDFAVQERLVAVGGQVLEVRGLAGIYSDLSLPLHGAHQAQNFAVALAAVEAFIGGGKKPLGQEVVAEMTRNIVGPGRLEVVNKQPLVIVDAAHNPAGAQACARAAIEAFNFSGILVLGLLRGKDARSIIQTFQDVLADRITAWCFAQSSSFRAVAAAKLADDAVAWGVPEAKVHVERDLDEALRWAMAAVGREEAEAGRQTVLVAGSVTMAAQARLILGA